MDHRLKAGVDSEDIVQEAYSDASQRLGGLRRPPGHELFLWLRYLTAQKLVDAQSTI